MATPSVPTPTLTGLIFMKAHSARVPGKNLRPFAGRPLCCWILEALAGCARVGRIVVNTDSPEIAARVGTMPKVVVHERPAHLLGDHVVANQIIEWDLAHAEGEHFLQTHSTNPLLTTATLDRAIEAYFGAPDRDSLFSVTEIRRRLYRPDGTGINHDPAHLVPTQELPPIYEENSCIYLFSRSSFAATGRRLGRLPQLFPTPPLEAVDIDEPHDFEVAEALMLRRLAAESQAVPGLPSRLSHA